jgi:hypothetical protein
MKLRITLLVVALTVPLLISAQSTPQQPGPPPQTQGGPGSPMQPGTMQHPGMGGPQGNDNMRAMHEKQIREMKQNIAKMKTLLEQMKTNAAGLTGKDKAAMDANVQLWQMMIDHMDQMVNHMSSMGMMGPGMGGPGMMRNHGAMPGGKMPPPPPPAPQQ